MWTIEAKNGSEWFVVGGPNNGEYRTRAAAYAMCRKLHNSMREAGMRRLLELRVVKK